MLTIVCQIVVDTEWCYILIGCSGRERTNECLMTLSTKIILANKMKYMIIK